MLKNNYVLFIVCLIFVNNIECRFEDDFTRTKSMKMSKILSSILLKKIQTDSITKDDVAAIYYLMFHLLQRQKALFNSPPIYWYSRKG